MQEQDLINKDMAKILRKASLIDKYDKLCNLG